MTDSKVIMVTGATDGIGLEAASQLYALGHHVLVHGRSVVKAQAAIDSITAKHKTAKGQLDAVAADLADLAQVQALVARVTTEPKFSKLSVLVNNAGVLTSEWKPSASALETQFHVNHLSHFVLSAGLLALLKRNSPSRIVNVSSGMHYVFPDSPSNLTFPRSSDVCQISRRMLSSSLHVLRRANRFSEKYSPCERGKPPSAPTAR